MNRFLLALTVAAATLAASAQTPSKPATSTPAAPKSAPTTTASKTTSSPVSTPAASPAPWLKLPPGVPAVAHGLVKTSPIVVHYEDIKIGTGAVGEPGKLWHLKYTGWRAADGVKFDSWETHKRPKMGPDGKPEMGPDKTLILGDPEPASFPQGVGGTIPGFDFGLAGMRIGGKRRIFIPWQLGYGTRDLQPRKAPAPGMPDFPGIPAKSDLIFDVELVDVTDMPAPAPMPTRPMPQVPPHPGASAPPNAVPTPHDTWAKPPASAPAQSASPSQPATTAPSATPAQSSAPAQPAASAPPSTPAPATAPTTPPSQSQPK
ncbi:MAG: FKBP-type peptidyl-prolyl cis-trans isomerase [Terracidiphilus sp.]